MKNGSLFCPCCGNSDCHVLYRKLDHPLILQGLSESTTILKCEICFAAFANPMPTQKQLDDIYNDEFTYVTEFTESEMRGHQKYLDQLKKLLSQDSGKILDVGCASGLLLSLAVANGWHAFGLDISEKLLEIARREVPQASLFLGPIERASYESGYFDVVVALNLLEHLRYPVILLREVNRVLRPGGIFLFKTVRIDSLPAQKRKVDWDHLRWPGHLIWYSKESLELLLQNTNFQVKKSRVTGVPYIPGVKRYLDHRIYTNNQGADNDVAIQNEQLKTSMPFIKKVMKIVIKNNLLKAGFSFLNTTFQLGDTITIFAQKKIANGPINHN